MFTQTHGSIVNLQYVEKAISKYSTLIRVITTVQGKKEQKQKQKQRQDLSLSLSLSLKFNSP